MKKGGPEMGVAGADPAASEALGRLFEGARSDGLAAPELEELWSRVGPAALLGSADPSAGAGTTGAPAGGGGALGALGGATAKVIAVVIVGGGLVAGGLSLRATFATSARSAAPHQVIVVPAAPQGAQPLAPSAVATPAASPDPAPGAVDISALPLAPSPLNAGNAGAVAHAGPRSRPSGGADVRAGDPELARQFPAQPGPSNHGTAGANATPSALGGADTAAQSATYGGSQATRATAASPPSPSEGALLLRARQEIRSDPAGALALTDEHARRFPAGTLAPEREVLAIEALAALGRTSEARARLGAFRDRYPQSPHVARLEALVAR